MTPFAALEKQANAGRLIRAGIGGLWRNGAWKTLGQAAAKGVSKPGIIGSAARAAQPVARVMNGGVGKALGGYGIAGMVSPLFGVDLPGSSLAMNLGMPIFGAANTATNLITGARAGSEKGRAAIKKDLDAGASRAAQDFISGLHVNPNVASDPRAYREFSEQIGRGMSGADTYTNGQYKPLNGISYLRTLLDDPNEVIRNKVRMQVQQQLPGIMKQAMFGRVGKVFGNVMQGLAAGGVTLGLGNAIFGKNTHDAEAVQDEGYAAAQAAIQNRLKNMSQIERLAARWDPTIAGNAIAQKFPDAMKQWESQYGPFQRGMLANVVNKFQNPGPARFYSTDMSGNRNYIN